MTNRALIAAAVAGGGRVEDPLDCEDTRRLAGALRAAGWELQWGGRIEVGAFRSPRGAVTLDLGSSGTGARLLLALLAAVPGRFVVDGSPRLRQRPMAPLLEALARLGARVESRDGALPALIEGGRLGGGRLELSPTVSSQFVSALLLAAPLYERGLELDLVGPIPSRPYLDLTRQMLERFGGRVEQDQEGRRFEVAPQPLTPSTVRIEGDWSAAAFFLAAAAVAGGWVEVGPLDRASLQGDRRVGELLAAAGVAVGSDGDLVRAEGPVRRPLRANLEETPDLFPALAVVAAVAPPGSLLCGLQHLRHKESDRLRVMVANLRRLGAEMATAEGSLEMLAPVRSVGPARVAVSASDDHRVAMAMAVAALRCGSLLLDDGDCVQKSFPGFWGQWETLLP